MCACVACDSLNACIVMIDELVMDMHMLFVLTRKWHSSAMVHSRDHVDVRVDMKSCML